MSHCIEIRKACENNLKCIDVDIPQGVICGICGVSGSGKSTLAKDVIAESGMKNFAYSLPSYVRNRIYPAKRPKVAEVNNLPPVLLIDVKEANKSSRSTVATISDLMGTLRLIYSQYAKSVGERQEVSLSPKLFSYNIQMVNDGGACENCTGTGQVNTISEDRLILDERKSIYDGGFRFISKKGVMHTKITEKFLDAVFASFMIDICKPIKDYTAEELDILLHGNERIINFTDRTGANQGKKSLAFPGLINALLDVYYRTKNEKIEPFVIRDNCPECKGTRFNEAANSYLLQAKSISEVLSMSIVDAKEFIRSLDCEEDGLNGIKELQNEFLGRCDTLCDLGVGYLQLSRRVNSVSGGELQRIKIAKHLASDLKNCCVILDEPSTGLHSKDMVKLVHAMLKMKARGNTVLLVEHNIQLLEACDYIIELGEEGGRKGGKVVISGGITDVVTNETKTTKLLKDRRSIYDKYKDLQVRKIDKEEFIEIPHINCHNLKDITLRLPLKSFVTIAGVSGSGKSTAINMVFVDVMKRILKGEVVKDKVCYKGTVEDLITLQQAPNVLSSRSLVGTLLEIMDDIRDVFADLEISKQNGFDKSFFSINSDRGTCEECNGSGVLTAEDNESEEICPVCDGARFKREILEVKYKNLDINDALSLDLEALRSVFVENRKITSVLETCCEVGLGYLSLGRRAPSLSKGEYQRVRIAKEICKGENKHSVFVLDEPSKGLHAVDVTHIVKALRKLVEKGNSVIAIEHNLDVIAQSDYVIELGPGAGAEGGNIIYSGTPADMHNSKTPTSEAIWKFRQGPTRISRPVSKKENSIVEGIRIGEKVVNVLVHPYKINLVKGGLGSGKTTVLARTLFAIPYKKYLTSISTQGKYYTKDMQISEFTMEKNLYLSRLIDVNERFFSRNERIMDRLDLSYSISTLYYKQGEAYCPSCGVQLASLNNIGECPACAHGLNYVVHNSTFDLSRKTSKCLICNGTGQIEMVDIDYLMNNPFTKGLIYNLLKDRTRYTRIAPLLKKEYGIDLMKDYREMKVEEREFFIFGNKKLTVKYKDKVYTWDGLNKLLINNQNYADDRLKAALTPNLKECPHCEGKSLDRYYLNIAYEKVPFYEILFSTIKDLVKRIERIEKQDTDLQSLLQKLNKMVQLGLGHLTLSTRLSDLCVGENAIVQYLSYRWNPLYDTVILWDNFSLGQSIEQVDQLIADMRVATKEGYTFVLADGEVEIEQKVGNVLSLSQEKAAWSKKILTNEVMDNRANFVRSSEYATSDIVNRKGIVLTSKSSIATYSLTMAKLRDLFKSKAPQFSFNSGNNEEKCSSCNGQGYYELNLGKIGLAKKLCPVCKGAKFSPRVLEVKVEGKNFAEVLNLNCSEALHYIKRCGFSRLAENLGIFVDLGLERVQYGKAITEVSYSEATLMLIGRFLLSSEKRLVLINPFSALGSDELIKLYDVLDTLCQKYRKTLVLEINNSYVE